MLIIGGVSKVEGELIDLSGKNDLCKSKQPFERWAAVGGVLNNSIIICGGKSNIGGRHQNCTLLDDSDKPFEIKMQEKRYGAASVVINDSSIWIVGGNNGENDLNSSEVISLHDNKGKSTKGFQFPFTITFHCMIQYAANSVFIIGGSQNGETSINTWIVRFLNDEIVQIKKGPELNHKRKLMSCSKMQDDSGNTKLIVAGGKDDTTTLDSVEILALGKNWIIGEKLLINAIFVLKT